MRTVGATTVGGGLLMTEVDIYCPYPYQWRDFMAALNTCRSVADACSVMFTVGSACIRITTPCGMHLDAVGIYRVPVMRKLREVSVLLHAQAVANPDNGLTTCEAAVCTALAPLRVPPSSAATMQFSPLLDGLYWGLAQVGDEIVRLRVLTYTDRAQHVVCRLIVGDA
ncbi:hypothetical protein JKP88DRAFT_249830 [Tribonema minus]|uniref:Uncharacterized protein n=1 Tax=Tribonema minus TaxID=303371 RepID=A0A835YT18_9STRA|nr:hypothetical protein JKP88DRAFT_249830 [Tribonema minus]